MSVSFLKSPSHPSPPHSLSLSLLLAFCGKCVLDIGSELRLEIGQRLNEARACLKNPGGNPAQRQLNVQNKNKTRMGDEMN